jgi:hypothetical protein
MQDLSYSRPRRACTVIRRRGMGSNIFLVACFLVAATTIPDVGALSPAPWRGTTTVRARFGRQLLFSSVKGTTNNNSDEEKKEELIDRLKQELGEYLEKRRSSTSSKPNDENVPKKVVGGTRGNAILDFISVSPAPERELTSRPPDVFDYDELDKYGYGKLATLMMQAGGRLQFYQYFGLDTPVAPPVKDVYYADENSVPILLAAPKYTGLQLGLLQDDDAQGQALERARQNKKTKTDNEAPQKTQSLLTQRGRKTSGGAALTAPKGEWTVERLDAWSRQQKELQVWANRERERKIQADVVENFDSLGMGKLVSVVTALTTALAFGRSTPVLYMLLQRDDDAAELAVVRVLAVALLIVSAGSAAYCGSVAPTLQRSRTLWTIKGLLGGPVAVRQLQSADRLQTAGEIAAEEALLRQD